MRGVGVRARENLFKEMVKIGESVVNFELISTHVLFEA